MTFRAAESVVFRLNLFVKIFDQIKVGNMSSWKSHSSHIRVLPWEYVIVVDSLQAATNPVVAFKKFVLNVVSLFVKLVEH